MKVPYWFDVEQLETGKDWQAGIDRGLANCQAFVLVVSNAAIGSPNVKYEWDAALKANKPIYLALFEAVDLPPELRNLPIIDFRANFKRQITRLTKLFQTYKMEQATIPLRSDRVPRPNRFKLPTRMPFGILIVFLTLLFIAVSCLVAAGLLAPLSLSLAVILIMGAVSYSYYGWRFATRQYDHFEIWSLVVLSNLLSALAFVIIILNGLSRTNEGLRKVGPALLVMCGLIFVGSLLSLIAMLYSVSIFRWSPLGHGWRRLRDHALHIKRRRGVKFTPLHKTYSLSYASTDKRVAAQVRRAMAQACYTEVAIEQGIADHNLVILSNSTPTGLFRAHSEQFKKPVSVVASSIRGAAPEEKDLRSVTSFQWVDYRNRQPQALNDMTEILWLADNGQPVSARDHYVVPESFGKPVTSPPVTFVVSLIRVVVAFYGTMALFGILGLVLPVQAMRMEAANSATAFLTDIVQIALCASLLWLCVRIMQRSVNFAVSLLGLAVIVILALVLPWLTSFGAMTPTTANTALGQTAASYLAITVGLDLSLSTVIGLFLILGYLLNLRALYRWLPLSNEPIYATNEAEPTLRQPFSGKLWRANAVFVVVFATGLLVIFQSWANLSSSRGTTLVTNTIDHLQLTMPQGIASMDVSNGDLSTIYPPSWLAPGYFDSVVQFIHNQSAYGSILWLGAYRADQASTEVITMFVWRFQPQPSDASVMSPDHPEAVIDEIYQEASSSGDFSNLARTSRSNRDTLLNIITYDDLAIPSNIFTHWCIALRGKQYNYLLFIIGSKQAMAQNRTLLSNIVASALVN